MGRIVATYDYFSADGEVLYQTVRYEPKTFRQRRPDGKGGWVWSLYEADGKTLAIQRVLYRLPWLLEDTRRMVLIVEGEKDADALAKLGFCSTTNVGGAGKWLVDYSRTLSNRDVALIADNDDPGRAHMAMVLGSLITNGVRSVREVTLPGLPVKGDASDWLQAGGTADQLKKLIRDADVWKH